MRAEPEPHAEPLQYHTPRREPWPPPHRDLTRPFRILAGVLAVFATLWGVFGAPLFATPLVIIRPSNIWICLLLFGPGYVVAIGYYWRAFGNPAARQARCCWGASAIVQGGWVGFLLWLTHESPGPAGWFFLSWWMLAVVASIFALIMEPGHPAG